MRIRKHAKICSSTYAASSLKPGTVFQTHVCQLNQSPWDVMSFSPPSTPSPPLPPPSFQVNENGDFARNGSFEESIAAFDSAVSIKMAMDDGETEAKKRDYSDSGIGGGSATDRAAEGVIKKDNEIVFCNKTDGKSWKCKRKAAEGNSLCEHHLSLVRNYNNWAPPAAKKADKVVADSRRRPRVKKAASASNPYEFYYYSGFGPRWGKKRGNNNEISSSRDRDVPKNIDHQHKIIQQSSVSQNDNEDSDIEDEVEYEDEDEENSESESRRKRARKPIKARSLKSLM